MTGDIVERLHKAADTSFETHAVLYLQAAKEIEGLRKQLDEQVMVAAKWEARFNQRECT